MKKKILKTLAIFIIPILFISPPQEAIWYELKEGDRSFELVLKP